MFRENNQWTWRHSKKHLKRNTDRKKGGKKNNGELEDNSRQPITYVIGIFSEEQRGGKENYFSNVMIIINTLIQDSQLTLSTKTWRKYTKASHN